MRIRRNWNGCREDGWNMWDLRKHRRRVGWLCGSGRGGVMRGWIVERISRRVIRATGVMCRFGSITVLGMVWIPLICRGMLCVGKARSG